MKRFLELPDKEKETYIYEAASKMGVSPVIIEKDFWVCLALEKLFQSSFGKHLTFKGGTSLSKVYKLIGRFSEDIDLTIDKDFVNSLNNATSKNPRKITKQSRKAIAQQLLPELAELLSAYGECILSEEDDQTILFHYPSVIGENADYIVKQVRIELGARGEPEPSAERAVTPYVYELLPDAFDDNLPEIKITVLDAERTFWEKATILHSIAHQPEDRELNERMSRHYHDLYMMSQNDDLLKSSLDKTKLLDRVVTHKKEYFFEKWDWYDSAKIVTLKLTPPEHLAKALKTDYEKMKVMLFDNDPIEYDQLIKDLQQLENKINNFESVGGEE